MPITLRPYDDHAAMAVFRDLDPADLMEAQAVRGCKVSHLSLFADWRAIEAIRVASWVIWRGEVGIEPIALLALVNTGQAGVASAAMVARDHRRYRRQLVEVGRRIRAGLPAFAQGTGVHRIEARAWQGHPRAFRFLHLAGFRLETPMPGFGRSGTETFLQFAWTTTTARPDATALPRDPNEGQPHVHVQTA